MGPYLRYKGWVQLFPDRSNRTSQCLGKRDCLTNTQHLAKPVTVCMGCETWPVLERETAERLISAGKRRA